MKTISHLNKLKDQGEKITMLTAYDASFAELLAKNGTDVLLVGDSLGNVICGYEHALSVNIDALVYHTENVARVNPDAFLIADLPFGTYPDPHTAFIHAVELIQAGAQMVKMEGRAWLKEHIEYLTTRGIPVCAHLGLTGQSVHVMGGYKIQCKDEQDIKSTINDAKILEKAGAQLMILECVPDGVSKRLCKEVSMPVIGIGAGPDCDGQVLVSYDMLGLTQQKPYKFVRNFLQGQTEGIGGAIRAYVKAVKDGSFPNGDESF